jgi:ABC-type branched-subunit amino acid transport system ATPase component
MSFALETKGLEKQFGGLKVTRDLSLRIEAGARHALIGPNGAGKTTVINLLTGVLKPDAGRILLEGNDITDLPVHTRVLRGLSRTFQINQLYADLTPLETIGLVVSERLGRGGDWWRRMGTRDDVNAEIAENLARFHLLDVMNEPTASSACSRSRSPSRPNRGCCCSMNRPPASPKASATISWPPSPRCRAMSRCC